MWRLTPGQALRHREWQGEYVLYNDISGDTHLLGAGAIQLLLSLQAAAAAESALLDGIGSGTGEEQDEAHDDEGAALLARLQALALIEPVT